MNLPGTTFYPFRERISQAIALESLCQRYGWTVDYARNFMEDDFATYTEFTQIISGEGEGRKEREEK